MKVKSQRIPVRVITHNVRYAKRHVSKGERPWSDRAPFIVSELLFNSLYPENVFICLQEALHDQLHDVLNGLNAQDASSPPKWAFIGVGRDDGKKAGEYSPILYQPKIWKLLSWKTTWLSDTPETPSRGWDAACRRILTTGIFQHRESEMTIVAMNTHLDDQGISSRELSANLILKEIRNSSSDYSTPVFLAGDINSETTGGAYAILTNSTALGSRLTDTISKQNEHVIKCGNWYTFTGFSEDDGPKTRLDYVFVGPCHQCLKGNDRGWSPLAVATLDNKLDNGITTSDHRAVIADLLLQA